jgi:hypothetical protein
MKLLVTATLVLAIGLAARVARADVPQAKITPLELGPPPSSPSSSASGGRPGLINAGVGMMIGGIAAVPTGFAFAAYGADAGKRTWAVVTACALLGTGSISFFTGYFTAQEGKGAHDFSSSARPAFALAASPAPGGGGLALRGTF